MKSTNENIAPISDESTSDALTDEALESAAGGESIFPYWMRKSAENVLQAAGIYRDYTPED